MKGAKFQHILTDWLVLLVILVQVPPQVSMIKVAFFLTVYPNFYFSKVCSKNITINFAKAKKR